MIIIYSDIIDAAQFIIQFQKEVSLGEEHATAVLENISNMYGTIFKRYRPSSRRFIKLTRKSNSGRANSQNESDRGRASAKTQQYQDRKAEQIDRVYLAAVENGDTETAQRLVDEDAKAAGYNGIKDTGGKNGGDSHTVWIPFSPEQIKLADAVTYDDNGEVIPLSERFKTDNKDIRFQDRGSSTDNYSYKTLINKPDMNVTTINSKVYNRADTVFYAKQNATKTGKRNNKNEVSVYVNDLNKDVILTTDGLRHGLNRKLDIISPVTVNIGEILHNSIVINELTPKNINANKAYVLIGIAKFINNEPIIVRSIVNEFDNTLQSIDTLYAVNAKKEPAATMSPRFANDNSLSFTDSTISISNLFDYVNKYYPDILPQSVLDHYGHKNRPNSELSDSIKFQDRESISSEDELLANASAVRSALINRIKQNKTDAVSVFEPRL